jgi:hypothetical protein
MRTIEQRLEDLEHDNNVLRSLLVDVQTENVRLSLAFEDVGKKCQRLIAKMDEFVNRFSIVQ